MKKFTLLCLTALMAFAMSANAQEKKVVMTGEDVNLTKNGQADLVINMDYETDVDVIGWNLYLVLPDGIDLAYDTDEEDYVYTVSTALHKKALRKGFGITVTEGEYRADALNRAGLTTGKVYMLYIIDTANMTPMTSTKGELLSIALNADETAYDASKGYIVNVALTDASNNSLDLGNIADTEFDIKVEGGIPTGINNINAAAEKAPVYNLGGQRVVNPAKGIFVKKGKKVVKK